jgi:hypothetical protein
MREDYVHGYSEVEAGRLADQANTLSNLLHDGTKYPAGSKVLEAVVEWVPKLLYWLKTVLTPR